MAIVDLKMEWVKRQVDYRPPREGLLLTATRAGIFGDLPALTVQHATQEKVYDLGSTNVNLLVSSNDDLGISSILLPSPASVPDVHNVGSHARGTARRVYQYIGPETGLDFRLGLTVHAAQGTWSSEPHDFEMEALKSPKPMRFWEKFAYITDPAHGWGLQTRQGFIDDKFIFAGQVIRDRDFLRIPLGVHPVTAGPGIVLAYIWLYQAEDITAAEKF
jgi:5-deoxy-D-glucuronate isomerase